MKRLGSRRMAGYVTLLLVLVIGAVVAVATASAASNKPYTATVYRTLNTAGSFTFVLKNDPKASQSLGSANFTPPAGFTLGAVSNIGGTNGAGFNVNVVGNVLQFRAKSNQQDLGPGQTVQADAVVTINSCSTATWGVEAKQSNDFSGQPGNDMTLGPASDLTPLGSFTWDPIFTLVNGVQAPAILTGKTANPTVHAYDTCGNVKSNYNGPTTIAYSGHSASVSGPTWSNGLGTASILPTVSETDQNLTLTDIQSGISATSAPGFDTQDKICTAADQSCLWHNGNNSINATANGPSSGSLGVGFNPSGNVNFVCSGPGDPLGGTVLTISPHGTPVGPYQVTVTYSKALSGSGPAGGFIFCESIDQGQTFNPLPSCSAPAGTTVDCIISQKRTTGGALQFVLSLLPGDPYAGGK